MTTNTLSSRRRPRAAVPAAPASAAARGLLPALAWVTGLGLGAAPAHAVDLRIEAGPANAVVNEIQRPKSADGTRFAAPDFTGRRLTPWRLEASWTDSWWGRDGQWRATWAPLRAEGSGVAAGDIRFGGASFAAGQPLSLRYQFDTWRLSYAEPFGGSWSGDWTWRVGGALAIRNARIRLQQGATARSFDNIGPVPLARVEISRPVGDGQQVVASFEGFPAPGGGGLFDGSVRWEFRLAPGFAAGLFFREQAGAAVDRAIFNRLQARSWGLSVTGSY